MTKEYIAFEIRSAEWDATSGNISFNLASWTLKLHVIVWLKMDSFFKAVDHLPESENDLKYPSLVSLMREGSHSQAFFI